MDPAVSYSTELTCMANIYETLIRVNPPGSNGGKSRTVLEVKDLKVSFDSPRGRIEILEGVQFSLFAGEILALVGETGCGKSTLGRSIFHMAPVVSGSIRVHGKEIQSLSDDQLKPLRPKMQMVFQDPRSSLNPKMTVLQILEEALFIRPKFDRRRRRPLGPLPPP